MLPNGTPLLRSCRLNVLDESARHARFVCEPLERGFGDLLGRSLRHALLNTIPCAAVVGARARCGGIEASRFWMRELCLSLADLALDARAPVFVRIEAPAGTVVRAAALARPGLQALDLARELCVAEEELVLELWIEPGHSMQLAVKRDPLTLPDGAWPVDAFFGPVRRADYFIERPPSGSSAQLERLLLDVDTNGAVTPRDALRAAARALPPHFAVMLDDERIEALPEVETAPAIYEQHLFASVAELEISVRAQNSLHQARVDRIGDLVQLSERQLLETRTLGRKSIRELHRVLAERGLWLGMRIPDWRRRVDARQGSNA